MADEAQGTAPDLTQVLIDLSTTLKRNGKPPWERRLWAFVAIIFSGALFWMVHTVNESDKTLAVMSANFSNLRDTVQEVKLGLASVVLVSSIPQSDSVMHIHTSILFPYRLSQNVEFSSLCYTQRWCLSIIYSNVYMFLEESMATHSSILTWRIPMDRGAWWATVHGVAVRHD